VIRRLVLLLALLLAPLPAGALSLAVDTKPLPGQPGQPRAVSMVVRLTGMFEAGDSARLREALEGARAQFPNTVQVRLSAELSSNGGDVYEGLKVGYLFREFAVSTLVRKGDVCLSACALAFLGGTQSVSPAPVTGRAIEIGGEVGFHSFWLNATAVPTRGTDTVAGGMVTGFNIARGGAALLVRYAAAMNIDMAFIGRLLGRPPEEWEYIDLVGEFLDFSSCTIGTEPAPAGDAAVIATNICSNSLDLPPEQGGELKARPMSDQEMKRHLLQHLQERIGLYGVKGALATQLGAALRAHDDRLVDQVYLEFRSAGIALPEVSGPAFEVLGYKAGAAGVQCHVSFSLEKPDLYGVLLVSDAGMSEPKKSGPPQCRHLMRYNRDEMLNPSKR
jgi:hypothetical protein